MTSETHALHVFVLPTGRSAMRFPGVVATTISSRTLWPMGRNMEQVRSCDNSGDAELHDGVTSGQLVAPQAHKRLSTSACGKKHFRNNSILGCNTLDEIIRQ
jgi:hypothetical protein